MIEPLTISLEVTRYQYDLIMESLDFYGRHARDLQGIEIWQPKSVRCSWESLANNLEETFNKLVIL